jgi:hypothetical protein
VLGRVSYSWYLWHWPFLVLSAALLPNISVAGKSAAAVAALAVAGASYHFVENPIRFHPALLRRPAFSLYLAAMVTLCSLGVAFLAMRFATRLANEPEMKTIAAAIDDIARMPRRQCVSLGQSPEAKTCIFGDAASTTHIVLFGDSHAIQWFNPLERIAESHGWKLTTMVKSACPAIDIISPRSSGGAAAICASWRAEAMQRIIALRPSIVFTGNASNFPEAKRNLEIRFSLDELRDGTRRTLEALTARGFRVAVMRDTPRFTYDVPTCLARSVRHSWYPGGSCEADRFTVLNAAAFESEKAGAHGLPNVHFIDLTDRLCRKDVCWAVQGGAVIYRDNNHLTGKFADRLKPVLEAELLAILNAPR